MAAVTEMSKAEIVDTVEQYGVGKVLDYWPATDGIENTNYFVRTESQRAERDYVLTLVETNDSQGDLLISILDRCESVGLPVAPAIRSVSGSTRVSVDGKPALLARRLPGRHVSNPTFRQCDAVGRFLGRFHLATRSLSDEALDHPRDANWLSQHAELAKGYLPYCDYRLIRDTVTTVKSMLGRSDVQALPRGVIHGDLFRDNALFNERGLAGILDFHQAARGFWIFDIAVAVNDWCNDASGVLDPERTLALLRAYHRTRPLGIQEIWYFPMFSLYAGVAFWLSRLGVVLKADAASRLPFKNPEEFREIVAQHTAHFFYLDPRLLED